MTTTSKKKFTQLYPVDYEYNFLKQEELHKRFYSYNNGISYYTIDGFKNYRDVTLSNNSCFILTSAIPLNDFLVRKKTPTIGNIPVSLYLQPRNSTVIFSYYNFDTNRLEQSIENKTALLLQPTNIQNHVRIVIDGKFLEVSKQYPYTVSLEDEAKDNIGIMYQTFEVIALKDFITIKGYTNAGYRYLAFNSDNVMRATGVVLNDYVVNDYVFKYVSVTEKEIEYNFIPSNNWVTYYYDLFTKTNNKNVLVNKNIIDPPTNFLIEFSLTKDIQNQTAKINFFNLKTGITPTGGPAPVENQQTLPTVTKNEQN